MKKLILILIAFTAYSAGAQVKIGNNPTTINSSSVLELESTNKGLLPPRMTSVQMNAITSPPAGLVVYCTDCTPKSLWQFDGTAWGPVGGVPVPTVVADCTGFAGAFAAGVPLTGATYKVTVTNNSFFAASPISFTAGDLILSGVAGLTVGAPTPTPVTLSAGGSQEITYPITGTPAATGTLTGSWSKITLSCSKTKAVGTLSSVVATNYCTGAALNGTYLNGVALGAGNTFTVTITNNSGFALNGLTAPAIGDLGLTWTGTGTLSVASVTPSAAFSIANGSLQTITYTLSGTPTSSGTFTPRWNYYDLTCAKTKAVTDGTATFTLPQTASVVSITNASPVVNIQGVINNAANKITFTVPYTGGAGAYPAYSGSVVAGAAGEGGDTNGFSVSYPAGTFSATGNLTVTVTVDGDGSYNVKEQALGVTQTIVTLPLIVGGVNMGNLVINAIGGIKDRRFGDTTTQGGVAGTYHNNIYAPIKSITGKVWLNNNLGANYSNMNKAAFNPVQQASAANDFNAYGSLYEWGRYSDGHELINWANATTGTPINNTPTATQSTTDTPLSNQFITTLGLQDWRSPGNNNLWQAATGTNNPCPVGYRVPTVAEIDAERIAYGIINNATGYASIFKLSLAGWRDFNSGILSSTGTYVYYYTSDINGAQARAFDYDATSWEYSSRPRGAGYPVRCISDTP